jgi:hypothetical protein
LSPTTSYQHKFIGNCFGIWDPDLNDLDRQYLDWYASEAQWKLQQTCASDTLEKTRPHSVRNSATTLHNTGTDSHSYPTRQIWSYITYNTQIFRIGNILREGSLYRQSNSEKEKPESRIQEDLGRCRTRLGKRKDCKQRAECGVSAPIGNEKELCGEQQVSSGLYCEFCYWEGRSKARPEGVGGERRRMGRAAHPPSPPASNTHALLAVNLEAGVGSSDSETESSPFFSFAKILIYLWWRYIPAPLGKAIIIIEEGALGNWRGWAGWVERKGRQLAKVNQQPAAHHLLDLFLCGVKPQAAGFTEREDMLFFFILLGCDTRWVLFLLWRLFGITWKKWVTFPEMECLLLVECPLLVDVPFFETPKGKQNLMKKYFMSTHHPCLAVHR